MFGCYFPQKKNTKIKKAKTVEVPETKKTLQIQFWSNVNYNKNIKGLESFMKGPHMLLSFTL